MFLLNWLCWLELTGPKDETADEALAWFKRAITPGVDPYESNRVWSEYVSFVATRHAMGRGGKLIRPFWFRIREIFALDLPLD
jgi:hypothetical protein